MDHVVEAHLQEADVRLRRVSASDAGSDRHTPEREQTFVEDVAEVFYGHFGPYFRPSTIIFSILTTLFFIALCRDGLSEPEEEQPAAVQEQEPISPPSFKIEDLDDWQRRPGRLSPTNSRQPEAADYLSDANTGPDPDTRIGIACMPWGESIHPLYDDAIATLEKYAQRHGYETFLLKQGITSNCNGLPVDCNAVDRKNLGGAWNKMLYLVQIITQELIKPEDERLEWIMWQEADATLILNPLIPLHIFLPPPLHPSSESTFLLATRDHNGFNSGVFFLRVHETALKFLIATLSIPLWKPDLDLGWYFEQGAIATLSDRSPWKEGIVWQPKYWWNTYDFEVKKGSLLLHLPGQTDDVRVPKMSEWLEKIEREEKWAVALGDMGLEEEIEAFWKREGEKVMMEKEKGREKEIGRETEKKIGREKETEKEKKNGNEKDKEKKGYGRVRGNKSAHDSSWNFVASQV